MTMTPAAPARETRPLERTGYSLYFAGQNIVYTLIQGYLLMFYVSYLGLRPGLVATIFLIVRIWDAVNDPLIGVFMDRVRFMASRFKGWINMSAVLMPLSTFALFVLPPEASGAVKITYLVVSYLLWDILFTISEVPSFAVSTSMTSVEHERTLLLTLTQIGSVLGAAAGVGVVAIFLRDGVDQINWFLLAGVPSVLAMAIMIPQMFFLKERHHTEPVRNVSLGAMLREVLRNDQHFVMMGLYVSQALLNAVTVFAVYVAERIYGNPQFANITALFSLLGVVILGVFTPMIVRRFGKRRYLEVCMILTVVLSIPVFFIPRANAILAMVFLGLRTMTLVVTSLLRPMFTADCVEYGQHKTGVRSGSVAFAVQTLANKIGDAVGVSLGGYILALAAFNERIPLADQSATTMTKLHMWYIALPMLMAAIMYLGPKLFYKLDEPRVKMMIADNKARSSGGPSPGGVSP
jgi:glycoside/pentoside/hexuronide:cation symporter, GPH family